MALFGVTFANQIVAAADDAIPQHKLFSDGVLAGFTASASGSTLTLAAGLLVACGRIVGNDANLSVNVSATSGVARVTLVLDLTGAATSSSWLQGSIRVDTASTEGGLPALVQEDINDGVHTDYEISLAVLARGGSGISEILSTCPASTLNLPLDADQIRHIKIGTDVPTTDTLAPGEIYLQYTAPEE